MRLRWTNLEEPTDDTIVEVVGHPVAAGPGPTAARFLLLPEALCCTGHVPRDPAGAIAVIADSPLPLRRGPLRLRGRWRITTDEPDGWRYHLHAAQPLDVPGWGAVTRRSLMASGPLMCLAATSRAETPATEASRAAAAQAVIAGGTPIDLHSHAGGIANAARIRAGVGFSPIAEPMRIGGMAGICLAVVSDSPTHHVTGGHIRPYRDPGPGELWDYGSLAFERVLAVVRQEGLRIITTAADLARARANGPSVIIAAEGADFLEGRIERLDTAHQRWSLRHLQLTHYRVNELGDIQTEAPVHGGLTDFGVEVIRRCNERGIVVDVAHGTFDLVKRAASVTRKPLILSHTSLANNPGGRSRRISPDHARVVASTGGVIGVWPVIETYPTLTAMATGMARLADVVGVDHVGLGSDMRGLVGESVFPNYHALPGLAAALLEVGFDSTDARKILGGNYARVFSTSLSG